MMRVFVITKLLNVEKNIVEIGFKNVIYIGFYLTGYLSHYKI